MRRNIFFPRFTVAALGLTAALALAACGTPAAAPSANVQPTAPANPSDASAAGSATHTATPVSPTAPAIRTLIPTATPTFTPTTLPTLTPTASPMPLNAQSLRGQILFLSNRVPPWGPPIWKLDPVTGQVAPCDPSAGQAPSPVLSSAPSAVEPMLTQSITATTSTVLPIGEFLARWGLPCQQVYVQAMQDQTFSPDKRFELFVGNDPNSGQPQIFVLDHSDGARVMVTRFGSGIAYDPAFAPDGYHIAFIWQENGQDNLYTMTRDGTDLKRLARWPNQDWSTWEWIKRPTWSPDGKHIAFWSNKATGTRQIWVVAADGSNLRSVAGAPRPFEDWDPVWIH